MKLEFKQLGERLGCKVRKFWAEVRLMDAAKMEMEGDLETWLVDLGNVGLRGGS